MIRLERLVPRFKFERHAAATVVPAPALDSTSEEVWLQPWHLGLSEHSFKGPAKAVYVLKVLREFLENPYDSKMNPIHVSFNKLCPGANIAPLSVSITNGFTKSVAMKILLIAVIELNLSDGDMTHVAPFLRACYGFRCIHKTSGDQKIDQFNCLAEKFSESSRPRPDPIQVSFMFKQILAQAGKTWNEGIDELIQDFNGGNSSDHKRISVLEAAVIKMFPTLLPETQELITYHWGNFQAKQSGLTLTMLGTDLLRSQACT